MVCVCVDSWKPNECTIKKKFKTEKKSINHTHIWIVHTGHSKKIKWKKMVQRKHEISSLYFFLPTFFFLKFISNMWAVVGNFTFQKILLLSLLNQLYWVGFNFKSLVNIVHTYLFNFGVLLKMEIWPISSSWFFYASTSCFFITIISIDKDYPVWVFGGRGLLFFVLFYFHTQTLTRPTFQ